MARSSKRKAAEPALQELADVTTALIYRAISRSGRHELARSFFALWWSGVGAGLAITENTVTPILPLLAYPSIARLNQTARLWAIAFAANMTGCLVAAILMVLAGIIPPLQMSGGILPALVGNVIGGTVIFAALAYA